MKLFLNCCGLIWICKSFIDVFRFNIRENSIESTEIFELRSSLHSCIKVRQNLMKRVRTLVLPWSWSKRIHGHAFYSCLNTWQNRFRNYFGACSWAYFEACSGVCFWSDRLVLFQTGFSSTSPCLVQTLPTFQRNSSRPWSILGILTFLMCEQQIFLSKAQFEIIILCINLN